MKRFCLLIFTLLLLAGCSEEEVVNFKRPVFSLEELSDFIGISRQDFVEKYPWSYDRYNNGIIEVYFENKDNILPIDLLFNEDSICPQVRCNYSKEEDITDFFIKLCEKSSEITEKLSIAKTEYRLSGSYNEKNFNSIEEVKDWLNNLNSGKDFSYLSINFVYSFPESDKRKNINLSYAKFENSVKGNLYLAINSRSIPYY